MPGGTKEGYDAIEKIVTKVAAQVDDGPCVTYVGPGTNPPLQPPLPFVQSIHDCPHCSPGGCLFPVISASIIP